MQHDPFFWDTVQLASKHAHHFYENGLRWTLLPSDIDSGHPPIFGWYLALVWAVFGKTLPASHWAMLPFLLLNIWLLYRLGFRLGGPRWAFWLSPLVLLDPVMAGQSILVSPDLVLICGFLFAVEGILGKNKFFATVGVLILCAVSVRGMMTAGALFAWQMLLGLQSFGISGLPVGRQGFQGFKLKIFWLLDFVFQSIAPFLPGFLFAAWFLWWHQEAAGWIGYHPGSPWAPTFEPATGKEMLRNLLVLGWRWLDFGRVFEWLAIGWLVWKSWPIVRRNFPSFKNLESRRALLWLLACLVIFLSPSTLLLKNVSAHRYFLPGFIALHLFVFQFIANQKENLANPSAILKILVLALALGNLWIYPRGIAMGWDATLAHLPYHHLRAEAVTFLENEKIDFQTVGSAFPNLNTGENLLLNGDQRRFADKDFSRNKYFFASNIFNDVSENDYARLRQEWILIKKWERAGVWIEIYLRGQQ